ncbi:hypothetical protein AB9K26_13605 [Psychroserpens sp. XS_ASV72]|uniref:hypothetical protein n=1 Tax=Psychroserpens sp. XS_ASV72 TaxID=3241293 RepID=UPI003514C417
MTTFDLFYLSIFNHYKTHFKRNANSIAVIYISLLQIALVLLLGAFFAVFFEQMHVNTPSSSKVWTLFIIFSVTVYFRNWLTYTGKKRSVLNAKISKNKKVAYNIWLLWLLLLGCIALAIIIILKA